MKILNPNLESDLSTGRAIKLNLGSGMEHRKGFYSLDQYEMEGIDVVADLNKPLYLLPDNCCDHIYSNHVFEHITEFLPLMREIYRILTHRGRIKIIVPHFSNHYGYSDPTHVRIFGLYSMYYFVPREQQPSTRRVPSFYTNVSFKVKSIKIEFFKHTFVDKLLSPIFTKAVNHSILNQDFYERRLATLFQARQIKYLLIPIKHKENSNKKNQKDNYKTINSQTIRIFPRGRGAHEYQITGIASRCDCVVLSDEKKPRIFVHRARNIKNPKHIFLSMRSPFVALEYFATRVLPALKGDFVLITGSEDITIPNQLDQRFRKFTELELSYIDRILSNRYLKHWFCENLDDASHPLISPIPTGMVFKKSCRSARVPFPDSPPLHQRPVRVLCAHRIRNSPQWALRKRVTELALSEWSSWCTVLEEEVAEEKYNALIQQHAFVLCVEGGGLDPSPKAWQTILNGAIPIVRETALKDAYQELPVVFVPDWSHRSISAESLNKWYEHFVNIHKDQSFKSEIIKKLGIDYWWNRILAKLN